LFAGLSIAVLLIHNRITAATLMQHGVGPLLFMAALTQACRVSSKRPHPPVSLSTYQDIIWNKFYFDCINNCPCVLTVYGKGHVFADVSLRVKRKVKFISASQKAEALHKFDWWIEYYCGQIPLWHK
jgi:hypothetical protein